MSNLAIGHFKKIDNKNRFLIPLDLMKLIGLDENGEAYIQWTIGEDCLRIYSKKYIDDLIEQEKNKAAGVGNT